MDDREESHAADLIPSLSYGLYGGIAHIFMHDREENHALDLIPSLSLRNQKSGKKLIYTTVFVSVASVTYVSIFFRLSYNSPRDPIFFPREEKIFSSGGK